MAMTKDQLATAWRQFGRDIDPDSLSPKQGKAFDA
jgi:hypothetical protein